MSETGRLPADEAWTLLDRLGAAYVLLAEPAAAAAASCNVTLGELVALAILAGSDPTGITQSEWGRLQGVSRQRAHVVTRRLREKGLCAVERSGRDSLVTLTGQGVRTVARLRELVGAATSEAVAGVAPKRLRRLSELLSEAVRAVDPGVNV